MPHICKLNNVISDSMISLLEKTPNKPRRYLNTTLVSETNPFSVQYFRSRKEIKAEKMRQLEKGYWYVIHPFSKFIQIYDFWLLLLYGLIVIVKPLDACIRDGGSAHCPTPKDFKYLDRTEMFTIHAITSTTVDLLSWSDIVAQFFIGFHSIKSNKIVLNPRKIAMRYLFGPFFVIDFIGSIPRFSLRLFMDNPSLYILGIQNIFCLAKGIKFFSFLDTLWRVYTYTGIKSNTTAIAIYYFAIFGYTMHYVTVLHISIGRITGIYFQMGDCDMVLRWQQRSIASVYSEYIFRASAYFLQVSLPQEYYQKLSVDEQVLILLSYGIGKIFLIVMWTNLAVNILATRMVTIRYHRFMTQVEDFLQQKKIPYQIKSKIINYYHYKYQGKYFQDEFLTFLMSSRLRQEVKMWTCRSLILAIPVFQELSSDEMNEIARVLIPEIILAADLVFNSGNIAEYLYFIYSGTVAIYTFSGIELCHLEDGAYFGEISFVLKKDTRPFSVIAVETCQLYKIHKKDVEKIFSRHKNIHETMIKQAKLTVRAARILEKQYKTSKRKRYPSSTSNLTEP
ncbi:potassium/sodium hyperpolarization-activated cyclic nucleotide-gated channel 3-like [Diorhabda carinulata]|uniref:potassium/sodium hyperpolarization-activated cyclic nucleotide-gated channel 3-like n=1 Tax=Diorhabda carinulata TaxID=1163345 RepID=UPI0025A0F504|nr:potassium/sodium hyperpolarization-activated cyclic nucleotide-gated channel 3-like [Diorhabda carinulata]